MRKIVILFLMFFGFFGSVFGNINIESKQILFKEVIISKTNLNKTIKGKNIIKEIDLIVEKISDSKKIQLYDKLSKLNLDQKNLKKNKDLLSYLKSTIGLEIYNRGILEDLKIKNTEKKVINKNDYEQINTSVSNKSEKIYDNSLDEYLIFEGKSYNKNYNDGELSNGKTIKLGEFNFTGEIDNYTITIWKDTSSKNGKSLISFEELYILDNSGLKYNTDIPNSSVFKFNNLKEGNYILYGKIDSILYGNDFMDFDIFNDTLDKKFKVKNKNIGKIDFTNIEKISTNESKDKYSIIPNNVFGLPTFNSDFNNVNFYLLNKEIGDLDNYNIYLKDKVILYGISLKKDKYTGEVIPNMYKGKKNISLGSDGIYSIYIQNDSTLERSNKFYIYKGKPFNYYDTSVLCNLNTIEATIKNVENDEIVYSIENSNLEISYLYDSKGNLLEDGKYYMKISCGYLDYLNKKGGFNYNIDYSIEKGFLYKKNGGYEYIDSSSTLIY